MQQEAQPRRRSGCGVALLSALIAFALFICINVVAAHFMSDCGLPAVLGVAGCSDDTVRAGWPMKFYEQGGYDEHLMFSEANLTNDFIIGGLAAVAIGVAAGTFSRSKM